MTIDAIQLSKDILESRQLTIEYNERVLKGILCSSEYDEHIQHLKAVEARVVEWRVEWV